MIVGTSHGIGEITKALNPTKNNKKMIIICLDIDKTITKAPKFFSFLTQAVKKAGGKVYIISTRTADPVVYDDTRFELKGYGIQYDDLYLLPYDESIKTTCPHEDLDWFQKYLWQKVEYCLDNNVEVYFDDDTKVLELFQKYAPGIQLFGVL